MVNKYHKHYDKENWSVEEVYLEEVEGFALPLIHAKSLKFVNDTRKPNIKVGGTVFLAPISIPYYHAVTDVVIHFEFIRRTHPDVQIVFCANQIWRENVFQESEDVGLYMLDILKIYNQGSATVHDVTLENIEFEHVVFFPNECLWQSDRPVPYQIQKMVIDVDQEKVLENHTVMLEYYKESVLQLNKDRCTGEKLYLTRKSFGPPKNKRKRKNTPTFEKERASRDYEDEDILIDFFSRLGYKIVDQSNLTMAEQIEICSKAAEIVAIKGSNIFNANWMVPGSKVHVLYTTRFWNYTFEHYFKHLNISYIKPDIYDELPLSPDAKVPVHDLIIEFAKYNTI